VSAAGAGGEVA